MTPGRSVVRRAGRSRSGRCRWPRWRARCMSEKMTPRDLILAIIEHSKEPENLTRERELADAVLLMSGWKRVFGRHGGEFWILEDGPDKRTVLAHVRPNPLASLDAAAAIKQGAGGWMLEKHPGFSFASVFTSTPNGRPIAHVGSASEDRPATALVIAALRDRFGWDYGNERCDEQSGEERA